MVGSPDFTRFYLDIYLFKLAEICKDSNVAFTIIQNSVNKIKQPIPNRVFDDPKYWTKFEMTFADIAQGWSMQRISVFSFVGFSTIASNIIWPNTENPIKNREARQKRKRHMEKFFPQDQYPSLNDRSFRNFLEHIDERLDSWDVNSSHHNIAMSVMGENSIAGDITIMDSFDPQTFKIVYHDEADETKTSDLHAMLQDLKRILNEIPKALTEIHDWPPGYAEKMAIFRSQ